MKAWDVQFVKPLTFWKKMALGNVHIIIRAHTQFNKFKRAENVLLWLAMTHNQTRVHGYKNNWQHLFPAWLLNQTHRPQTDIQTLRRTALKPAKQTKMTYSIIAFNEDNVSQRFCRDRELNRAGRGPPHKWSWWLLIQKLWILNNLVSRSTFSPQTPTCICPINGNSAQMKFMLSLTF